jgi:soluble lytic murein transglycosylase-like protein
MSTEAISQINVPDALAASQRVQQLQALVTEASRGTTTASFAAALAAASSGSSAGSSPGSAASPGEAPGSATTAATTTAAPTTATSTVSPYGSATAAYGSGAATTALTSTPGSATGAVPTSGSAGSTPYDALISQAAERYGLDPAVLHGLIQQESGFDPNSQSSAGAAGLTQLMPATASSMGVSNPLNPAESIEGGARYLSQLMTQFGGNTTDALAAYNAGPGAVKQYGGVPPYAETQDYVTKVLGYANAYRQSQPASAATGQIT